MTFRGALIFMVMTVLQAGTALPIGSLSLEMKPRDAEVLFRKDPNDKSSFPVVLVDGDRRLKGRVEVMGSSTRRFPKKSLLIKLDAGQSWRGQRRIALGGMQADSSWMRNWLAWDTIRALGMPSPEVTFQQLSINGRSIGLYLQTEWLGAPMFARHGLGSGGPFFQPSDSTFCGDFVQRTGWTDCWAKLAPADGDFSSLAELAHRITDTAVGDFHSFVQSSFEGDTLLHWLLVNVLACNGDTYNKNYFLYRSPQSQRWTIVPWDYDLAFGRTYDPFLIYPNDIFNASFVYYYPPELGPANSLKEKTLRNPVLRERFLNRLGHILGVRKDGEAPGFGAWSLDTLDAKLRAWHAELRPLVPNEAYPLSLATFDREVEALRHFVRVRTAYLRIALLEPEPWWNAETAAWDPAFSPAPPPLPTRLESVARLSPTRPHTDLAAHGWGFLLAGVRAQDLTTEIQVQVAAELAAPPKALPPGAMPAACLQRGWQLTLQGSVPEVVADLTLEYLQENSRRNELGSGVDETELVLWMLDEGRWKALEARFNTVSNSIEIRGLRLPTGRPLRFVAVSGRGQGARP